MGKAAIRHTLSTDHAIFEDLDRFHNFCRDYGYKYNEADLYNFKSYAWQQFNKFASNKNFKDMWSEDLKRITR